jgi:hypothetical protein
MPIFYTELFAHMDKTSLKFLDFYMLESGVTVNTYPAFIGQKIGFKRWFKGLWCSMFHHEYESHYCRFVYGDFERRKDCVKCGNVYWERWNKKRMSKKEYYKSVDRTDKYIKERIML